MNKINFLAGLVFLTLGTGSVFLQASKIQNLQKATLTTEISGKTSKTENFSDFSGNLGFANDALLNSNQVGNSVAAPAAFAVGCYLSIDENFDNPVRPNTGNNMITGNNYNGWSVAGMAANASPFNIFKPNSSYSSGPIAGQGGSVQYLDLNSVSGYVTRTVTLDKTTVVSASAWFANRDTRENNYPSGGWNTRIELLDNGGNLLKAGNTVTFTKTSGHANWVQSSFSNVALPAGTYTVRMFVSDFGHVDSISCCFALDTDGDGISDDIDLDDDNDGILDCTERGFTSNMEDVFAINGAASQVTSDPTGGSATYPYQIQLTPNENNKAGQLWSKGTIDFTKSFTLTYQAYLGNDDNGADGIAAVFHNDPDGVIATGSNGFGIGARGIKNGIVLELDTYNNGDKWGDTFVGDIGNDHGMIWDSDDDTEAGLLTTAVDLGNIEDNKWHNVIITWDVSTNTLKYTVDGIVAGEKVFSNIANDYFGGSSKVHYGYTASTGGNKNDQRIKFIDLCSDFPGELDTDGDGIPDHLDLDSDGDGCPDAVEGSENVTVAQLLSNGAINTADTGGFDGQGVPNLVNNGGAADTDGSIGQGIGTSKDATVSVGCKCEKPAATSGTILPVNHGITALGKAGANGRNWPMVRKGAWTALESHTKGFVVNRIPTTEAVDAIADPQQGMMVYDEEAKCLKIYVLINAEDPAQGGVWKCLAYQACPDSFIN